MPDLDTSLLRVFVTVADRGSMTAGARALNLTQGAVSQKIARLEAQAGGRLLTRERQGMKLTPSGERLLGKAQQMLALNDEIWSQMNGGALDGCVRLGLPVDLVGSLFSPILKSFLGTFPQVELLLRCGSSDELRNRLAGGHLDIVVLEEPLDRTTGECLLVDRLVWVGMRGGTAHLRTPLPISLVSHSCCFRPEIVAILKGAKREARTVFENGGLEATLAVVRMDMAVSAWLASSVPADLMILNEGDGLPTLPPYALTLQRPASMSNRATSELVRHFREVFSRPSSS